MNHTSTFLGLAASVALAPAAAQDTLALDRFSMAMGRYASDLQISASGKGSVENAGDVIDFDRDADVSSDRQVNFFELQWRPLDRHDLRVSWFRDERSGERTLDRTIEFEGTTFPIGADVQGRIGVRVLDVSYTWWALLREQDAFGLTLGMVRLDLDARLSGTVQLQDLGAIDIGANEQGDLPAPKLGLDYAHAFNEHLRLRANVATFQREVDGIDARIWDAGAGLEWLPWRHLGFELRYGWTRIDGDGGDDSIDGSVNLKFRGAQALVRARW